MKSSPELAIIADQTPVLEPWKAEAITVPETDEQMNSRPDPGTVSPKRNASDVLILDVQQSSIVRGTTESEDIKQVRARKTAVTLKLAPDSPAGLYEVSVFDESGRQIGPSLQRSSDGRTVSAVIDFSKVVENVRVCVSLKGEIPDCVSVMVRD